MKFSQHLAISYIRTKFKLLSYISKKKAAAKAFDLFCTPQSRHKKPLPAIFHEGEKLQFTIHGNMVRGWRWNHPGNRKVLILHGFESSVTNFDRYIKPLTRKGYEVLAFDAPAHGRSGGKKITAPVYKDTIKKIHELYGPVESCLAHSLAGLAVALALEEIPHTPDFRLALIAPATETSTAIDSFFQFLRLDPLVREEFENLIVKAGNVSSSWYSIKRAMKKIKAQIRWYHDEDDDTTPLRD